ncbi:hypothetical protein BEP19_11715 [Ammoniphilus oxalaticus]|uniref:Uncharacterized protein n=1 Tax=Ammoniphilus oxalaticus TaxID=66863 RepID=A0A419SGI9_9BACL|nr:hypothetical protein [Ammoniphilus oxalaticus]RKD22896.1 hypothetical protein BEP19_11715 [Ammoniphilus oxalaticus]
MAKKNFLAGFVSIDDAQAAEQALNEAGFTITQVDQISPYPGEGPQQVMNPLTGNIPSLGYLTLDAEFNSKSAAILAATDVSASGMSDGDGMMPEVNQGVLLTAVVPADQAEQAEQIIKQYGGNI